MNVWSRIVEVNIGRTERYGRALVGFVLLVMTLAVPTGWGLLGLYPVITGVFGTDPLYTLFGLKTTPTPSPPKPPRSLPPMTDAT